MAGLPQWFVTACAFAVGAVVGSFLNVLIHRVPRGESIVRPASRCPRCGRPIRWYDNVPILSWILLRARCRDCAGPIPVRYPLVELAGGLVGALAVSRWGPGPAGIEAALFSWITVALALIDLEHQILPDVMTLPSLAGGLAFSFAGGLATPLESLLGAVVGAAIPALIIVVYKRIRGIEGMGWGDVKYLGAIGAVVGVQGMLMVLILGAVSGALVGLALVAAGRGTARTALPFGTFLGMGVLVWLYGPSWLWSWAMLP